MLFEPFEFERVPLDRFESHALTPQTSDVAFRGIVITAPDRVVYAKGERPRIPVCGFAQMDVPTEPITKAMVLVVVDPHGEEWPGPITDRSPHPKAERPPSPRLDPATVQGLVGAASFNPDAVVTCAVPARPGSYRLRVEHRGFVSNEVRVELVEAAS